MKNILALSVAVLSLGFAVISHADEPAAPVTPAVEQAAPAQTADATAGEQPAAPASPASEGSAQPTTNTTPSEVASPAPDGSPTPEVKPEEPKKEEPK